MNKRKLLTLALTLCMVAILAIGGTMAYFTDTDQQKNVFTTGNVQIDLFEDFAGSEENPAKLMPTTGKDTDGKQIKGIEKEVYVENEGTEAAYVRVHIAIPDIIDSGAKDNPALNASDNIVHFNMAKESIAAGKWSWLPTYTTGVGYEGNGEGNWNVYETTIGQIDYNVYVVTYRTALKGAVEGQANDVTPDAIWQVYMDVNTTNEQITTIKETLGNNWNIYVAAEGCQEQGFANAYEALNTTFGDPQDADYETKVDWSKAAEGDVIKEMTSSKGF